MQHSRIRAAFLLIATLATASLVAQQQGPARNPSQDSAATFRGGINFVRVDVAVTDKKQQPVADLKQADFEVLEDGKPQSIEQFRLIRVDGNPKPGDPPPRQLRSRADEESEAARDDVRVFVIFLDDYHVRAANALAMRQTLTRFIQTQLRPLDLVAIMYPLTPVSDLDFTRNFDSVAAAAQKFEGRKYDYRPRNTFEEQYQRYPAETVEQIRNSVVMSALRGLSVRLGAVRESRKTVIYVSEGFTVQLPEAMRRADASVPEAPCVFPGQPNCNPSIGNPMRNEDNPREQTAAWFQQSDLYSRMRDVFTDANRNNVAIYTLDPRGLAVAEFGIDDDIGPKQDARSLQVTQDTLKVLAEQTDGRAIVNRNNLNDGLAQIAHDASFYYLIGYNSSQAPTDGKFHEIKVHVKRPGVEVRARKGYWAVTVEDLEKANNPTPEVAKPVEQALASIAPSVQSGKFVRTWIGTERGENGKTRMTLIWEPLPVQPGVRREAAGRVSVLAADQAGNLVFRGRSPDAAVASTGPPQSPGAPPATAPQKIIFDVPPGKLELRLTVEGAGGAGTLDQEIKTMDVPDLTAPQIALSTPRVYRARTARELNAVAADANATPTAGREFSRTERVLIRFDTYGPGTEHPAPAALLMNRSGQKMLDLMVVPATTGVGYQIDLGLNTVPPGEYLVEVTAKGPAGEKKELIPLRVTS